MHDQKTEVPGKYAAFCGNRLVVHGELEAVLRQVWALSEQGPAESILIFEDSTGRQVEFDMRGSIDEVLARAVPKAGKAGPGRPKLGVVSREVSLLPRHWDWLEQDPQGISAALRRLVDEARKRDAGQLERKLVRDSASRFMWTMAGNLPNFEEATRALFAGDRTQFRALQKEWPSDIVSHLERLTEKCFDAP